MTAGPFPGGTRMVWEYQMRGWRNYAVSSVAQAIGTPLLYLLALGLGLGRLVHNGPGAASLGVGYENYIAPALLVAGALQIGVGDGTYPTLAGFKWTRVFWGITSTPVSTRQVADGRTLFIATRIAAGSALYYLVMLALGVAGGPAGPTMVVVAVLVGVGCSAWTMSLAATIRNEGGGAFNAVSRFVVVPMSLFSGSFFPISRIPGYLRWLTWISPLWHGNELARGAALGTLRIGPALGHVAFLLALVGSGLWMVRRRFGVRLTV